MLTVKIRRSPPEGDGPSRWDRYQVAVEPKMSVLDVVARIQNTLDPSLAFRFSCRAGMCGTCSMRINGRNRWSCRTGVAALGDGPLTLEPLPNYPVVRDLVVDMAPFFRNQRAVVDRFIPADPGRADFARIPQQSAERREINRHVECITCGNCFGSCGFVESNPAYLGPAALNRAYALIRDSRDGAAEQRLEIINSHDGVWGCHTQFNCTEACPMGISPTRAIQKLKRREIAHAIARFPLARSRARA